MFKGSGWYVTDYSDKLKPAPGDEAPASVTEEKKEPAPSTSEQTISTAPSTPASPPASTPASAPASTTSNASTAAATASPPSATNSRQAKVR